MLTEKQEIIVITKMDLISPDVLVKKIQEDVYIEEVYLIMNDLINLTKK